MSTQTAVAPVASSPLRRSEASGQSPISARRPSANVLGIAVDALNMEQALARVAETLRSGAKGYVCAVGVHGVMEAQRDAELAETFALAAMTVPDGMPMVWVGRMQGHRQMQRVAGPDLMLEIFDRPEFSRFRHFLYGGNPGVAEQLAAALRRRFPGTRIVGTYTPPFRNLTISEENEFIATIDACKPDLIWVGISAPRQEQFMRRYLARLNTRMMFGVGAAFDFHTGRIQDSPVWVKLAGLQWLHRLIQEPRRLWWRYLRNNPEFIWRIMLQLTGIRTYPRASSGAASVSQSPWAKPRPTAGDD